MKKILRVLEDSGIDFTIHRHDSVLTMDDVIQKLPFPADTTLKTLVFKIRSSAWVLAVLKAGDKIDYRKLATALAVPRAQLSKATAEEIQSQLDLQVGGISPIPTRENIQVLFDAEIAHLDVVYCGVGANDETLQIRARDLIQVSKGEVYPITRDKQDVGPK